MNYKMIPLITKNGKRTDYSCPKCGNHILSTKDMRKSGSKYNYCPDCGQGLDWSNIVLEIYWPE